MRAKVQKKMKSEALTFGNTQINLVFRSLIRTFATEKTGKGYEETIIPSALWGSIRAVATAFLGTLPAV